jgi:hypothetical protein
MYIKEIVCYIKINIWKYEQNSVIYMIIIPVNENIFIFNTEEPKYVKIVLQT